MSNDVVGTVTVRASCEVCKATTGFRYVPGTEKLTPGLYLVADDGTRQLVVEHEARCPKARKGNQ